MQLQPNITNIGDYTVAVDSENYNSEICFSRIENHNLVFLVKAKRKMDSQWKSSKEYQIQIDDTSHEYLNGVLLDLATRAIDRLDCLEQKYQQKIDRQLRLYQELVEWF